MFQELPNNASSDYSRKLKDKRAAVAAHLELTKERSHDLKYVKVQPHVCYRHKLVAQVMTSNDTNAEN